MRWIRILCLLSSLAGSANADDDFLSRQGRATFVPRLTLGVRGMALAVPGLAARSVEVFAWVRWPLERQRLSLGTGSLAGRRIDRALEAAARLRAREEIAGRPPAVSLRRQIDDVLDAEEAEAALDALGVSR